MPATVVHSFFANDVYDILPVDIQEKLNINRCKMFGQSMDSLMFYNLFSVLPGKNIRRFQGCFHMHKTQEYFLTMLEYIREHHICDEDVYSFLIGCICHFSLDATLHPYIIYKCGVLKKGNKNTYKYNNVHAFMESFLDNDMISRRWKGNPYYFDVSKFSFDIRPFSRSLENTINYTFYHTFRLRNMSSIYYKSLKQMKWALRVFRRDPHGIKKAIYKLMDTFTTKGTFRYEAVSYHYPLVDKHHYLNEGHALWRHPAIYDQTSTDSFVDLYIKAIKRAKTMICASFDYLDGKDVDLKQIFLDHSYVTDLDCEDKRELKYFEF